MTVVIAILGVIFFGISSVIQTQVSALKKMELKFAIESDFNTMSRMAINPIEIGKLVGLKVQNLALDWIDNPSATPLSLCLTGKGTLCDTNFSSLQILNPAGYLNESVSLRGTCGGVVLCDYKRSAFFKGDCTPTACSALVVILKVAAISDPFIRERTTEIRLNQKVLLGRRDISFACVGPSGPATKVDFDALKAVCAPIATSALSSSTTAGIYPIQAGHSCIFPLTECPAVALGEFSCPEGFSSLTVHEKKCLGF